MFTTGSTIQLLYILINIADIEECQVEPAICEPRLCRNTVGSYECTCPNGFTWDGMDCEGIYIHTVIIFIYAS